MILTIGIRIYTSMYTHKKENMMVGSDCGFGTSAWGRRVESRIAWAKLEAMVEGARLASKELW